MNASVGSWKLLWCSFLKSCCYCYINCYTKKSHEVSTLGPFILHLKKSPAQALWSHDFLNNTFTDCCIRPWPYPMQGQYICLLRWWSSHWSGMNTWLLYCSSVYLYTVISFLSIIFQKPRDISRGYTSILIIHIRLTSYKPSIFVSYSSNPVHYIALYLPWLIYIIKLEFFKFFWDRILCILGWPWTHFKQKFTLNFLSSHLHLQTAKL